MVKKASNFFKQNSVYGLDITFKKRSLIGNSKKAVRDEEWLRQRFLHPKEKRKFNRVSVGCKKKKKKAKELLLTLKWVLSQQSPYCLGSGFQICWTRMSVL